MSRNREVPGTTAVALSSHLRSRAVEYFPHLDRETVDVRLLRIDSRSASTHYHFVLGGVAHSYRVLVKVRAPAREALPNGRETGPRAQLADPVTAAALEFRALSAIQERFAGLDPRRFGSVRALDSLPEHQALILEVVAQPSLLALFARSAYLRSAARADRLEEVFQNTGAWLRHYHTGPRPSESWERRLQRTDLIAALDQLTTYLGEELRDRHFFAQVGREGMGLAASCLPERLPGGLGHGDFAMRNVLVGPAARVTVIDTHGAWYMPVYEDIGYFLHGLRYNRLQVFTGGAAIPPGHLARYEGAFLGGYFGDEPVPHPIIRLYGIHAMLAKWASLVASWRRATGSRARLIRSVRLRVMSTAFRESVRDSLMPGPGHRASQPVRSSR